MEKVLINRTRISNTIPATKIGTILVMALEPTKTLPAALFCRIATETPHQVRVALKAAARNQAANRYQTSAGSSLPCSGVKMRAMPAKSMAQKANARIVAQRNGPNDNVPRISVRANNVLE